MGKKKNENLAQPQEKSLHEVKLVSKPAEAKRSRKRKKKCKLDTSNKMTHKEAPSIPQSGNDHISTTCEQEVGGKVHSEKPTNQKNLLEKPFSQKSSKSNVLDKVNVKQLTSRIYEIGQSAVLVLLNFPETLTLKGSCLISCIHGAVDIFGYRLTDDKNQHPFFSSESNSFLTIESVENGTSIPWNPRVTNLFKLCSSLKDEADKCSTILLLENLCDASVDFVSSVHTFRYVFRGLRKVLAEDVVDLASIGVSAFSPEKEVPRLIFREDYKAVKCSLESALKKGACPVYMVTGGGNVGKSTMASYLLNSALNIVPEVAYLECDLGQSMFTTPGCIAVTKVTRPVLGPAFMHHRMPLSCCYVGQVSPGKDPTHYIKCLTYVFEQYRQLGNKCPLIVNTMGWVQGLGLALLTDIIRILKPDDIIQLMSHKDERNAPLLTPECVASSQGWSTDYPLGSEVKEHSLVIVNSVSKDISCRQYSARDYRDMNLLHYFGQMFDNFTVSHGLNGLCPFEVPWHKVAVHVSHASVTRSQVMFALNASIVGLCIVPESQLEYCSNEGYPHFLRETPICQCLGIGIVRAIDPVKKVFYILTPLLESEHEKINCFLKGTVTIPDRILLEQTCGDAPFIGNIKDVLTSEALSASRNMWSVRAREVRESHTVATEERKLSVKRIERIKKIREKKEKAKSLRRSSNKSPSNLGYTGGSKKIN